MSFEAALVESAHHEACRHLLAHLRRGERQEDLCFALWRPGRGASRTTALVSELILPEEGERTLHGGASFAPEYLSRSVRLACARGAGLAFLHSHPTEGWQPMSRSDVTAERTASEGRHGPRAFPLWG